MNKEKIKMNCHDPPSDEQKYANRRNWLRGLGRKLVRRRTLLVAIRILSLTVRLIDLLKHP